MKIYVILITTLLLVLSSCVTILHSLVTMDNIINDDRIVGSWTDSESKLFFVKKVMDSKFKSALTETKTADKTGFTVQDSIFYSKHYVISYQEKNIEYTWIAGLVRINEEYYLNLIPEECLSSNGKEIDIQGKETSSIAKLIWNSKKMLTLNFLNGNSIRKIVLEGKAHIKYEYDPLFETFVIAASSSEQELFLKKYGNNESLFRGGKMIVLTNQN